MQNTQVGKFLDVLPDRYFESHHVFPFKPPYQFIPERVTHTVTFQVIKDGVTQILTSYPLL